MNWYLVLLACRKECSTTVEDTSMGSTVCTAARSQLSCTTSTTSTAVHLGIYHVIHLIMDMVSGKEIPAQPDLCRSTDLPYATMCTAAAAASCTAP